MAMRSVLSAVSMAASYYRLNAVKNTWFYGNVGFYWWEGQPFLWGLEPRQPSRWLRACPSTSHNYETDDSNNILNVFICIDPRSSIFPYWEL